MLKNKKLQKILDEKGFVKFKLLDLEDVKQIKNFFKSIEDKHNISKDFFHTTLNTSNADLIKKVNNYLLPILTQNLNKHLQNYQTTMAGFLVKESGKNTNVTVHQDWNFVDEDVFSAYNLWVSLDDADLFKGNMQFIPYSHKIAKTLRVSPDISGFFSTYQKSINSLLVDVPTKAGDCVLFNQAIVHASRENLSTKNRHSCITCCYPAEAQLLHYYMPEKDNFSNIEVYNITIDSMLDLVKDKAPPKARLIDRIAYVPPVVSEQEFKHFINSRLSKTQKIKNFFITKLHSIMYD